LSPACGREESRLSPFAEKRCLLVTGKGGVGRSTIAGALAVEAARRGRRVLLTEVSDDGEDYSPLARHFQRHRLPTSPEELQPGVRGVALLPRLGQEMFFKDVLHSGALVRAALASETVRRLLNAGPSFREMGIYYQLLTYLRAKRPDGSPEYETIVVDMPATGHTLSLTGLPDLLLKLVSRGPIADALREGVTFFHDPVKSAALIVTLPEMLPVTECLELVDGLVKTRTPIGAIILNRVLPDPFTLAERDALRPVVAANELFGSEGFHRNDLARRAGRRLAEATQHPIRIIDEMAVPERALVGAVADQLEKDTPVDVLLAESSELRRASS
jgi:anion-transporting  ArsA/GET3 family ATPase